MPRNGDVSGYTGVFRLASPSDPHRKVIKRNRQVVSCVPCRTRKLKCDRQQPCASCVRRGDEDSCRFFHAGGRGGGGGGGGGTGSDSSRQDLGSEDLVAGVGRPEHGPGGAALLRKRREVQARLQRLESMVSGLIGGHDGERSLGARAGTGPGESVGSPAPSDDGSSRSTAQTSGLDTVSREDLGRDGGHLSRRGDDVRFVGATNYAAVLECIRDLQGFVDADVADGPETAVRSRSMSPPLHRSNEEQPLDPGTMPMAMSEVLNHLPPRAECDALLTFYFQQIYLVPVLIHSGQFQRAYEKFWEDPGSTSLLWTSILFTLLSTATFLRTAKTLARGDGPTTIPAEVKKKMDGLGAMAYRCLLAGDHLKTGPFCVEATLLFGMHLVLQKRDAEPLCWHTISTAVRLAQRMGYHRDASTLGRVGHSSAVSAFEAEMRRRTWCTLEYFDLVYSFQIGVPPIIQGDDVDTQLPTNLRDDEFDEFTSALPRARSTQEFSPILCAIYYSRQVRLLRRVVHQALAVAQPSFTEVKRLDSELRALHEDVPLSLRYRPVRESGFADVPDVIMRRMVSEMMHLKSLVVLHRRYLTLDRDNKLYDGVRETCLDSSLRLLDMQAEFDEQSGEGGRLFEKRYMLISTGYHDFLVAAMCVCLDLIAGLKTSSRGDQQHKIESLKRARAIWNKNAGRSKEASHAANVLGQILERISVSGLDNTGEQTTSRKDGRDDATARAEASSTRGTPRTSGTDVSAPSAGWTTMNKWRVADAPSNRHSFFWDSSAVEYMAEPTVREQSSSTGLWRGEDWNMIDSFLLDRDQIGVQSAARPGPSTSSTLASERELRRQTEPWPYLSYEEPVSQEEREVPESGRRFLPWSKASMPLNWPKFTSSSSTSL